MEIVCPMEEIDRNFVATRKKLVKIFDRFHNFIKDRSNFWGSAKTVSSSEENWLCGTNYVGKIGSMEEIRRDFIATKKKFDEISLLQEEIGRNFVATRKKFDEISLLQEEIWRNFVATKKKLAKISLLQKEIGRNFVARKKKLAEISLKFADISMLQGRNSPEFGCLFWGTQRRVVN